MATPPITCSRSCSLTSTFIIFSSMLFMSRCQVVLLIGSASNKFKKGHQKEKIFFFSHLRLRSEWYECCIVLPLLYMCSPGSSARRVNQNIISHLTPCFDNNHGQASPYPNKIRESSSCCSGRGVIISVSRCYFWSSTPFRRSFLHSFICKSVHLWIQRQHR